MSARVVLHVDNILVFHVDSQRPGTLYKGRDRSLNERKLRDKLLENYDKNIMPAGNDTMKFLLRVEMILTGIAEVVRHFIA